LFVIEIANLRTILTIVAPSLCFSSLSVVVLVVSHSKIQFSDYLIGFLLNLLGKSEEKKNQGTRLLWKGLITRFRPSKFKISSFSVGLGGDVSGGV